MTMTINGSGTITGLSAGGLPDATIQQADLATGVAGTGPAFSAYLSSATQSLANATLTKIILNAEEFDTAACFDSTTNYRFTPNVAGYYLLNGEIYVASAAGNNYFCTIYKNGIEAKRGQQLGPNPSGATAVTVTGLVYLNGSTDYVELFGHQASGGVADVNGNNQIITYFQGFLVRAA